MLLHYIAPPARSPYDRVVLQAFGVAGSNPPKH